MAINTVLLAMRLLQNRERISAIKELVDRLTPPESEPPTSQHPVGSVEWLQESLNTLTNADLDVDGEYGPATKQAVSNFQQKYGIKVDGWAGPETVSAIVDSLAA